MKFGSPIQFSDAVTDATGGNVKVQRKDYLRSGLLPVIDQGQDAIAGYTDDAEAAYQGELPVILFGDHTRAFKYADAPFALGADGVKVLAPKQGFNAKFLFYYFQSCGIPSRGYSRHFKYLREISVPYFTPSEQYRVVELLDQVDALRRLCGEADAKVARILPALFLKMFGDPVDNPLQWPTGTLGSFGGSARYGLGQPPNLSEAGLPLLRATNIDAGNILEKNLVFVAKEDVPISRSALLSANEVIVVRSGAYTGDVAQVTDRWAGSVAGYDLVVTPPPGWTGEFVEQMLLTAFVQRGYFESQKGRAGQPHLNSAQVEATPVFRPTGLLQEEFSKRVRAIRKLRDECQTAAERVESLFGSSLQRAFSGQLTAKWRQLHMSDLLAEMQCQAKALDFELSKEIAS